MHDRKNHPADRNSKALFASSGTHPLESPSALVAGHPAGAPRRQAVHGAAWLGLVLDRRRRRGEGSASGMPWGDGLGKGDWEGLGGKISKRPLMSHWWGAVTFSPLLI